MREQHLTHFVGLDVGTGSVRCVVGALDSEVSAVPSVVGQGTSPNVGMRKGVPVHIDDVAQAIAAAVGEAERVSGVHISGVTVNINGAHVSGMNSKGVIAISAANREITHDDRMRAEEAATIVQLPANREIVQVFAKNYRLDGQDNIKDPVGMHGVRLEVDTHIVTAATPALRSLDTALERAGVLINNRTLSSLASAEAVLDRKQKESGTAVIDIGASTANMVIIEEGEIEHVVVIPIGGNNITNDLAIGLKTELEVAEMVKLKHASLARSSGRKPPIVVRFENEDYSFDAAEVRMIVEARVEELFELIDKELKKVQRSRKLPGGVVLVGGTAKLPGIAEFARETLQLPAKIGKPRNLQGLIDDIQDPSYATAAGLMLLDMLFAQSGISQGSFSQDKIFGKAKKFMNRFMKD